jgi:hypothetical protein
MDELEEVYVEVVNRFDAWEAEIKQKTEAHLLLRLLRKRFGELPELVTARVNGAPADQIEDWSEKLLDAASIDALFDESALTA